MAQIYISLGSNIHAAHYIKAGVRALQAEFGELVLSSVFESEAVGFNGSNFLNMVAVANTSLSVTEVVARFKQIERDNGRTLDAKKFSPRTLDLDLLLYDNLVCQQPVELPRAEITVNAFVLWPLAEVAPSLEHPVVNQSYQVLWEAYNKDAQKLWPIEFSWID